MLFVRHASLSPFLPLLLALFLCQSSVLSWSPHVVTHHQKSKSIVILSLASREEDPSKVATSKEQQRKEKKNKYKNFSKVTENTDPFEQLLAESNQKLSQLEQEREEKKKRAQPQVKNLPPLPKISFPDNKGIDPYDPTTFGYSEIGHVTGAHGVNGWIKIQSTTDFSVERLCTAGIRHLKPPRKRAPRQVVLIQGKHRLEDEYLVQLQDVTDREAAFQLRGSTMYVRQEDPVPIKSDNEEDEYLVSDLVGLEVRMNNTKNTFLGIVNGLVLAEDMCSIPGLGHDTLEVLLQEGPLPSFRDKLVLIPLVEQIVPLVDVANGFLLIDPPAGLLDLTYVKNERVRIKGFLPSSYDPDEE
mmetsp:Transcript_7213/g.9370  ORF Transcript_7213/g.9370 Transcript_7213/m.9370 type:complete len:357 (+) Transcript_7213:124-1194(+)|eukprot:CAMPEP_0198149778 /NCGR_PEP_ID=MMETSP1443-20131203/48128_1 /TAXON_ID=186043 /ORGANISM="Entomoneis sp., Strain CCMP2396" /LENGTH=356 /DNA_ID=CAMNT_0043814905 /DNA_START=77 /DNA_END=1147 /DNA_ORIENTATION=+